MGVACVGPALDKQPCSVLKDGVRGYYIKAGWPTRCIEQVGCSDSDINAACVNKQYQRCRDKCAKAGYRIGSGIVTRCAPGKTIAAGVGEQAEIEMTRRADDLMREISELEEKLMREERRRPIVSPVPDRSTDEEVREHKVTHCHPKPWCPYCTKAIGLGDPHSKIRKEVPDVKVVMDKVPTISC